MFNYRKLKKAFSLVGIMLLTAMVSLLTIVGSSSAALAQTTPTPGANTTGTSNPPAWIKDVPAYDKWQKLEIDDAALVAIGISRAQFYVDAGLSADPVATIADFYVTKLEAAGWKAERVPLPSLELGQQITFTNAQLPGAQLIVLVANKTVLALAPQFKTLGDKVPDGQNLIAIAAPLSPVAARTTAAARNGTAQNTAAASPTTAAANAQATATGPQILPPKGVTSTEERVEAPNWFQYLPTYSNLQNLEIEDSALRLLGIGRTEYYIATGITPDSVTKVAEFYTSKLKAQGWANPAKSGLPTENVGQQLVYRDGKLIILIASKAALGLVPQFKALNEKVPEGQTIVALLAPGDAPPKSGTRCKAGVECTVGPYKVLITFSTSSFNTTDKFVTTIERLDKPTGDWQLTAEVAPSTSTEATPVKFNGDFEKGNAAKRSINMDFPIAGNWYVYLTIKDAAGESRLLIPVKVDSPPVMDEWLAWTIGLAPLIGIVGFGLGQWRMIVRRKRTEQQQTAEAEAERVPAEV